MSKQRKYVVCVVCDRMIDPASEVKGPYCTKECREKDYTAVAKIFSENAGCPACGAPHPPCKR